jgi:hypothetical protein
MAGRSTSEDVAARVLEAAEAAGGTMHDAPALDGLSRDQVLDAIDPLLCAGLLEGIPNRGDDRLMAVRDLVITGPGRVELQRLRRSRPRPAAPAAGLDERRRRRAAFMRALYELVDASTLASALPSAVAGPAGLTVEEAESVVEYLGNDGMLEMQTFDGDVSITHRGIKEVELSLARPDEATEHFPPASVYVAGNVYGLQANTSRSTQHVEVAVDDGARAAIEAFVRALREVVDELPDGEREAARADLDTVDAQLRSPRPRGAVLREALGSLRSVAEGAAGSGAFAGAVALAQSLPPT